MATYYFNINNAYTTSGDGTTTTPANYAQLEAFLSFSSGTLNGNFVADGDVMRIKGTYVNPTIFNLNALSPMYYSITITSWEDNVPWIIDGVDDYVTVGIKNDNTNVVIKNGIIDSLRFNNNTNVGSVSFKNCIFYTAVYFHSVENETIYFYGCTFNNVSQFSFDEYSGGNDNSVYFWDSVFINSIPTDNGANYGRINQYYSTYTDSYVDIYNSVSATSNKVLTGNDYDWVPSISYPTNVSDIKANSIVFSQFNVPQTGTTSDRTYNWISLDYFSDSYYDVNRAGRGAFYFGEFEYTEYYVNNSGTSTSPYDTPDTGATNFKTLQDNVSFLNGDIINFVTSGGVIDDTDTSAIATITNSLTFRSYSENTEKPTWVFDDRLSFSADACNNTTIDGISFSSFSSFWHNDTTNLTVENCDFIGQTHYAFFFIDGPSTDNVDVNRFKFHNNTLSDMNVVLGFDGNVNNVEITNNTMVDVDRIVQFSRSDASELVDFKNFTFSNNDCTNVQVFMFLNDSNANYDNMVINNNTITSGDTSFISWDAAQSISNFYFYDNTTTDLDSYVIYLNDVVNDVDNFQIYNNTHIGGGNGYFLQIKSSSASTLITDNILIKDNNISNMTSRGITLYLGNTNSTEILNNMIETIDFSQAMLVSTKSNSEYINNFIIENNIIYNTSDNNASTNIIIGLETSAVDNFSFSYNNVVQNNQIANSNSLMYYYNSTSATATNSQIVNNIFYSETSATEFLRLDSFGDDNTIDYNNYYGNIELAGNITVSGTSGDNNIYLDPLWTSIANDNYYLLPQSPDIKTGISADDIGAVPYVGENKIGAFYFGPSEKTFVVNPLELTLEFVSNVANIGDNLNYIFNPLNIFLTFPNPTILNYSDVAVDFIGIPRKGTSPLVVDFTAYVTLLPEISTTYEIVEYIWSFDATNDLTISGTSVTPNISHTYTGYSGETFDVKLTVKLDCK